MIARSTARSDGHYAFWRQELGTELPFGAFGEK
jgi:MOSC domain-containing protein YiiM